MKRASILVPLLLVALIVAVGFYRGWFVLSTSSSSPGSDNANVNLAVDSGQVKSDAQAVQDKTAELTREALPSNP